MNELWKSYPGYNYEVSTTGNVKSPRGLVKQRIAKDGYYIVNLYKNGTPKTFKVHRLVAQTFIPNPDNLPQVNHKDENKLNNSVENLEWCDIKYNINYGTGIDRRVAQRCKKVNQLTLSGELVRTWSSLSEIRRQTDYNFSAIAAVCRGERKKHRGFTWCYID